MGAMKFRGLEKNPQLPNNYQLALGRLNSLLKRIQVNSELLHKHDSIIQDQLKKEIVDKVDDETKKCTSMNLREWGRTPKLLFHLQNKPE